MASPMRVFSLQRPHLLPKRKKLLLRAICVRRFGLTPQELAKAAKRRKGECACMGASVVGVHALQLARQLKGRRQRSWGWSKSRMSLAGVARSSAVGHSPAAAANSGRLAPPSPLSLFQSALKLLMEVTTPPRAEMATGLSQMLMMSPSPQRRSQW